MEGIYRGNCVNCVCFSKLSRTEDIKNACNAKTHAVAQRTKLPLNGSTEAIPRSPRSEYYCHGTTRSCGMDESKDFFNL